MGDSYLMGRGRYIARQLVRKIWFRATLFSLAGILTALVAAWVAPLVPLELSLRVGGKAVDNILTILASSMLAVTTFALSAAVTAYGSATTTVTPRATKLLIDDRFTQNALSTFVGTFLFSIVGIIALTTGLYGAEGRVVLFFATIVIVAVIALTLLRWIQHLTTFGRVLDTIERVEAAARGAMQSWATSPHLGAQPPTPVPGHATPVFPQDTGYVVHLDVAELAKIAARRDLTIHIDRLPGAFVHPERSLACIVGTPEPDDIADIAAAFSIKPDRDFDQDPRFGLIVLAEIASRALSPAVNDPGTAIRVLGAGQRVLADLADTLPSEHAGCHARVHAPNLAIDDLLEDFFRPIARDGATIIEVQLRLGATLRALARHAPSLFAGAAERHAAAAVARAGAAMDDDGDLAALRAMHRDVD